MILVNILITLLVILLIHHFYNVLHNFFYKKKILEGLDMVDNANATNATNANTVDANNKLKTPTQYKDPGLGDNPTYLAITNAANISFLKSQLDDLLQLKQTVADLNSKVEHNSTAITDLGQSISSASQEITGASKEQMAGTKPIPQVTGI